MFKCFMNSTAKFACCASEKRKLGEALAVLRAVHANL